MYEEKKPVFLPALGAILGSVPGMILWAIAGSFGVTWALLGLLIVAGAFIGYEKLGGDSASKQGLITCTVVILLAVYFGAHLAWAMQLHSALKEYDYDISLGDCVRHLHAFLGVLELRGKFIGSLLTDYLFAGLGALGLFGRASRR